MPATNAKAGRMACETCGDDCWIKTTSAGKLAYKCDGCGSGHFAEKGDRAFRKWGKAMRPYHDPDADTDTAPQPLPATKPEPAPAAKPPPARKSAPAAKPPAAPASVFSMGL